jgi:adenylate kinase
MASTVRDSTTVRHRAILLLGPTGSGKTPLGDLLERRGFWDRGCHHFDFGANLRDIVARGRIDERISAGDIGLLRDVLQSGTLLEDRDFPLAARILDRFITDRPVGDGDWLVLNGLPRHTGQAKALERVLHVEVVICLECSPDVVLARIGSNAGGDRLERQDDDPQAVARKLAIFSARTAPLAEHYRELGARVVTVPVTSATRPEEILGTLLMPPGQGAPKVGGNYDREKS